MTSLTNICDYNCSGETNVTATVTATTTENVTATVTATTTENVTSNLRNLDADSVAAITISADTIVYQGENFDAAGVVVELEDHEERITTAEGEIDILQVDVSSLENRATSLEGRMTTAEGEIDTLQTDVSNLSTTVNTVTVNTTDLNATGTSSLKSTNIDGTLSIQNTAVDKMKLYHNVQSFIEYSDNLYFKNGSSNRFVLNSSGTQFSMLNGIAIVQGNSSPNTVVSAPVGALYLRRDGTEGATLYIKESGAGNTGWTPAQVGTSFIGDKTITGNLTVTQDLTVSQNLTVTTNATVDALESKKGIQSQSGSNGATQANYICFEWLSNSLSMFVDTTRIWRAPIRSSHNLAGQASVDVQIPFASEIKAIEFTWDFVKMTFSGTVSPAPDWGIRVGYDTTIIATNYNAYRTFITGGSASSDSSTTGFEIGQNSTSSGNWYGTATLYFTTTRKVVFNADFYGFISPAAYNCTTNGYNTSSTNDLTFIRIYNSSGLSTFDTGSNINCKFIYD